MSATRESPPGGAGLLPVAEATLTNQIEFTPASATSQVPVPGLSARHLESLVTDSAISIEDIVARGYRTVTDAGDLRALGYADYQCRVPGLLIPNWTPAGRQATSTYRPDKPRTGERGKARKYELPEGGGVRLDVPPRCRKDIGDPSVPLYITEGNKKADSLASHGLCAVALCGVYNFRGTNAKGGITALGDWEDIALNDRTVRIVYDSDVMHNPSVKDALVRITKFLKSRDANVRHVYLPDGDGKMGVDDYFARGGTVEALDGFTKLPAIIVEEVPRIRALDWAEILASADEAGEPDLITGLVADQGLTLWAGEKGGGKTFLLQDAMVALATGGEFLGKQVAKMCECAIAGNDSPSRTLDTRFAALAKGRGVQEVLPIHRIQDYFNVLKDADRDRLVDWLLDKGIMFLGIDTLGSYCIGAEMNDYGSMAAVFQAMRDIIARTNVSIWMNHHLNRQGGVLGSVQTEGAVEYIHKVTREGTGPIKERRIMTDKIREGAETGFDVNFNITPGKYGGLVIAYISTREAETERLEEAILKALGRIQGPATARKVDTLVREAGVPHRTDDIYDALPRMVSHGDVRTVRGKGGGKVETDLFCLP